MAIGPPACSANPLRPAGRGASAAAGPPVRRGTRGRGSSGLLCDLGRGRPRGPPAGRSTCRAAPPGPARIACSAPVAARSVVGRPGILYIRRAQLGCSAKARPANPAQAGPGRGQQPDPLVIGGTPALHAAPAASVSPTRDGPDGSTARARRRWSAPSPSGCPPAPRSAPAHAGTRQHRRA